MLRPGLCIICVLTVVGCKKSEQAPAQGSAGSGRGDAPGRVTTTVTTKDAAPAALALVAREDGVGPITETTKVDQATLSAAFPGHEVKPVSIPQGEDLIEEYWGVSKGGTLLLKIEGDEASVGAVHIVGGDVANPLGLRLGMTHADATKLLGPLDCTDAGEAVDWRQAFVECGTSKSARFTFDVTDDENGLSGKQLLADPDALATAKIVAITWTSPAAAPPSP